ncbi:TPA: tail fiber assembly protein, partial [Escherichia coli]|nr:tail fiber assembly protein [Escherichia coli]
FQKWNGTAWVKDTEAEKLFRIREAEETKNSLMQVASEHIAPLQDAVDRNGERNLVAGSLEKVSGVAEPC